MRSLVRLCLIFLFGVVIASSAYGADARKPVQNCAPATPPALTGSLSLPPATPGTLYINEVLLIAHAAWDCSQNGKPSPYVNDAWVEIYNAQAQAFDLSTVHTSLDVGSGSTLYTVPIQTAIAPNGFIVIFPCKNALFRLSSGLTLRLIVSGTVVDQVQLPGLSADQSYARISDGAASWQYAQHPTIDASNTSTTLTPTRVAPTPTPISPSSGGSSGTGTGGTGGGGTGQESAPTPIASVGTSQGALHLPDPATVPPSPVARSPAEVTHTSALADAPFDLPRAIMLTIIAILALFAVFWGWRRFGVP